MEIRNYINIIWRRKLTILITLIATMATVVIVTNRIAPVYEASTVLRVAVTAGGSLSYSDYMYADRLMNTYTEIATSTPVINELKNRLNLSSSPQITAEIIPNTELIKITVEDTNPALPATIANTLADILVAQKAPQYAGGKMSSQELLGDQIAQAKTEFDQAQQAYNTLQAQSLPDNQQLDAAKQLLQIKQNDFVRLNTQYEQVVLQADAQAKDAPRAQKDILAKQKAILAQQLDQSKIELAQAQDAYTTLLTKTLPNTQRLDAAEELLKLKKDIYATLSAQYIQTILQGEILANMITVIDAAVVPQSPSQPRVALNYALGLVVGLIGGLGLAFIFENFDTTLYNINDIETTTKLPALVKIPKANESQITTFQEGFSPFIETFRNLATNLQMINSHQTKKILLLMSAEPNQGKSMIAFHLACSLAELGKEVVVVDCDTRLPRLHNFFHLPNQIGLKDVLEQKVSLEDALQKSSFEGVHVLTSGFPLAHPSQMLGSVQMTKLVKSLSQQFDYVLLDSPAMLAVADGAALTPNANSLILVVRQGHAQRDAVQATSNYLAEQNGKPIYLIVNQVNNASHYHYYQQQEKIEFPLTFLKGISGYFHKQQEKAEPLLGQLKKISIKKVI
jgi:capsular exopolysaccharide synthesis family protein